MRADRVISMIFTLQQQGRMTAGDLAAQLEVSVRTILRDVETLSSAGVPIYTTQGAGGGIEILDGFRSNLTGFTADESAALFLAGQPELAALLGLGPAARAARRKLLLALPATASESARTTDDWFLHDPLGRDGTTGHRDALRLIARAIHARVEVRVVGDRDPETIRPLGLVLEAGHWHVVHLGAGGPEVRALNDLIAAPPVVAATLGLGRGFTRPGEFDLAGFWRSTPR